MREKSQSPLFKVVSVSLIHSKTMRDDEMKRKTSYLVIFRHSFALIPVHVPAHVFHVKFLVL